MNNLLDRIGKTDWAASTLKGVLGFLTIGFLATNIYFGSEVIKFLPGILSGTNAVMEDWVAYSLMSLVSVLEFLVFSRIVDLKDGIDGPIEWLAYICMWIILPFDVFANVVGIVIANSPISGLAENFALNITRFTLAWEGFMTFEPEAIAFFLFLLFVTLAAFALGTLVGIGPEIFGGFYVRAFYPDFYAKMREYGAMMTGQEPQGRPRPGGR